MNKRNLTRKKCNIRTSIGVKESPTCASASHLNFQGDVSALMVLCKTEVFCAIRFVPLWAFVLFLILLKSLQTLLRHTIMAGATKISVRAVAVLVAVGLGYGATKVNFKALLLNTLTGPGSVSRIVALAVVLANLKNLPFVWHVSFPSVPACIS